jgi:ankyrin repeat protein
LEKIALLLLKNLGPDFDFNIDKSNNALAYSCALKNDTIALALLNSDYNININLKNKKGQDALTFSFENGYRNVIDILMERNYDLNAQGNCNTPQR